MHTELLTSVAHMWCGQVDTTAETGVADWNYIDYVRVFGATKLQAAALPDGVSAVVYVPDAEAFGADSFEYRATDCPGDLFRFSADGVVSFDISA